MSRTGTPCYRPRIVAKVFITIVKGDSVDVRLWRGRNKRSIRAAAKEHYGPGAKLTFGAVFYTIA